MARQTVALPAEVAAGLGKQGLEGVTATVDRQGREIVWVAVQRELSTDPAGIARLGRYDVVAGTWSWFGYQLETTTVPGDWMGLSEITVVDATRSRSSSATSSTARPPRSSGSTRCRCPVRRRRVR